MWWCLTALPHFHFDNSFVCWPCWQKRVSETVKLFFHHAKIVRRVSESPFNKMPSFWAISSKDCNFSNPSLKSTPAENWNFRSTASPPKNRTLKSCSKAENTFENYQVILNIKTLMSTGAKQVLLKHNKQHLFLESNTK